MPGSSAAYTIELLPVAPYTKCTPGDNVADSMIDRSSRSLRIRVTGRVPTAKGMDYRSLIGAVKRDGFLDFLYFTDYETSDAVWYALSTSGRPTGGPQGDVISWAANNCNKTYYYNGRGSLKWNGKYTDNNTTAPQVTLLADPVRRQRRRRRAAAHQRRPLHLQQPDLRAHRAGPHRVGRRLPHGLRRQRGAQLQGHLPDQAEGHRHAADQRAAARRSRCRPTPSPGRSRSTWRREHDGDRRQDRIVKTLAYPTNGVIYVKNDAGGACPSYKPLNPDSGTNFCGNVRLMGTYGTDLTIATENDIIIDGDVKRSTATRSSGSSPTSSCAWPTRPPRRPRPALGLDSSDWCDNVAATANRTIEAAILSLKHSFTVDNYYCGHPIGTLTVKGVIAQRFRGPVGTGGASGASTGYIKNYQYDDRLAYRSPPNFLDPVQSAWRVSRYTEQSPARHG